MAAETKGPERHMYACGCAAADDRVMYPCKAHGYLIRELDTLRARYEEAMEALEEIARHKYPKAEHGDAARALIGRHREDGDD